MLNTLDRLSCGSNWWHWTYLLEWVVPPVVAAIIWASFKYSKPYCRAFNPLEQDISLHYTGAGTFPSWTIPIVGWIAPVVWSGLCAAVLSRVTRSNATPVADAEGEAEDGAPSLRHDVHNLAVAAAQAVLLALSVTDPLKNYAGRLRPDYVARLTRELGFNKTAAHTAADFQAICDSSNSVVMDGRRSFPSGHSSTMAAGWMVASLFVYTRINASRISTTLSFCSSFVFLLQMMLPFVVAVSRTRDNRHNFSDILAGCCIGVIAGCLCFRHHFTLTAARNRRKEAAADYSKEAVQVPVTHPSTTTMTC
eukprot:Rhum_TRINITY_DN20861_c0_g1::Rhum_TRINITY_DN20861_c0_g1_i1::g.172416::m.172416/K18693/DPP1, DPPL, PLPP4_5; diacylglycerol diphosphate phosphatase / phosphatidate phosphatase